MRLKVLISCLILFFGLTTFGQNWDTLPKQEEELGLVRWIRSYDEAMLLAREEEKPIFILFQEVPGCSTCKNYGNALLTHPHIVEAIEIYFVPLVIFNNKGGKDAEILRKFGEPSWNNPVVRVIDPETENDITKRLNGRYDMKSLVNTISNAILASHNLIPEYLNLLSLEYSGKDIRETHFAMYCFWSGEKAFGDMEGVVSTKAGFMNGSEVVKIKYDAGKIDENSLIKQAASQNVADAVYTNDQREVNAAQKLKIKTKKEGKFRPDNQPKYYTFNTTYKYLPMTHLQSLKVNSALANGSSPNAFLSPRQLKVIEWIKSGLVKNQIAIDKDFTKSWNKLIQSNNGRT